MDLRPREMPGALLPPPRLPPGLAALMEPPLMLPAQVPARFASPAGRERQLWVAVLDDALRAAVGLPTAVGHHLSRDVARKEARSWFASESDELCSFLWVCAQLGFDASALRSGIARLIERRIDRHLPRRADAGGETWRHVVRVDLHPAKRGRPLSRKTAADRVAARGAA